MTRSRRVLKWVCEAAIAVLGLTIFSSAGVSHGAMADCMDATCRITAAGGSCGTGCTFEIADDVVYVLTAAHVVADAQTVQCEFWRQGHQSEAMAARVTGRSVAADTAVLAVPKSAFGGLLPTAIPLAPRDYVVRPGETLMSVGCAGGAWSTGWKGHALGYDGEDLRFVPSPANGRSGSAVFDADGRQILAIIRARTGDNAVGIATSLRTIYRAFDTIVGSTHIEAGGGTERVAGPLFADPRKGDSPIFGVPCGDGRKSGQSPGRKPGQSPTLASELTQCGPAGCPLCPQSWSIHKPTKEPESHAPYPTLPAAPPVDLKPLDDKLGRIAELLNEMRADRSASRAAEKAGPSESTDPQARRMAQEAMQGAGQALDAAKAAQAENARIAQLTEGLASQVKDVSGQAARLGASLEKTSEAVLKSGTLGERIELLKQRVDEKVGEDASKPEKIRAFIHEAVTDKTEWLRIGLVFAMALPLLIFVLDYAHHKKSGDPLLIEKLATQLSAAATQQPMLVPAANIASHAAQDVTGLLALLNQQSQAQAQAQRSATPAPTVVVAQPQPAATTATVATPAAATPST